MPTFDTLVQNARAALNTRVMSINGMSRELEELRAEAAPDASRVADLRTRKADAEADLPNLERALQALQDAQTNDDELTRAANTSVSAAQRQAPGTAVNRSAVYTEQNSGTFLTDLYAFSFGGIRREQSERLERHENEVRDSGRLSERAVSTTGFAGIVPPAYLVEEFALAARAGRPTANVAKHLPLPAEGMSLIIPKGGTAASTAVQATENSAVSNTDETWTNITVPVITIAGQQDVSRQSLERASGVDQIVFGDLALSYALSADQQVLSGTGASGQALGILATAGVNQATIFGAAVTVASFYSKVAGQINAIQTTRFLAPDVIIMHPRRWNWLLMQLDSTNRPIATPEANGPTNSYAVSQAPVDLQNGDKSAGRMLGLPVILDASIPTNVGTPLNDQVIVARWEDLLLWEDGDGTPTQLRFEQTLGNQLTVKLVAYGYAAFTAGRYPTAVGLVGGNDTGAGFGLIAPTF